MSDNRGMEPFTGAGYSYYTVLREKIKDVFANFFWHGLIRFWVPVKTILASTCEHSMLVYRLCCIDNLHKLKKVNVNVDDSKEEEMLISGPPMNAIVNCLPEVVMDLSVYKGNPLVDSALECGFTCSMFLPVFSYRTASCIGMVECSVTLPSDLGLFFSRLKIVLGRVGLNTFNAQELQPYKAISGFKCAKDEIVKALYIVSESHNSTLAQVWINYEPENHVSRFAVSYSANLDVDYNLSSPSIKGYVDACDMFPLKLGEGLTGKTLQTSEPLFCTNVNQLTDNGILGLLPANNEYSFLAICLRSIHTGDLKYAFEFLWPRRRDYLILLESLLLILKRCLPSFRLSYVEKSVLDVDDSLNASELRKKCINSLDLNCKTTSISSPQGASKKLVTMTQGAAKNHYEWQGRSFTKKRKSSYILGTKTESTGESSASSISCDTSPASRSDKDTLTIKAEYEDDVIVFHLPLSSVTLADVRKEIDEGFNLNGNYSLTYLYFTKVWVVLEREQHLIGSLQCLDNNHMRVKVVPKRSLQSSHVRS